MRMFARLASFIGVPPSMEKLIESVQDSPGLKWKDVGPDKPSTGTEIEHEALVELLRTKTELSQQELDDLNVHGLSLLVHVKVDDRYFEPVQTLALDEEFERRSREVYLEVFPVHAHCDETCTGHMLPEMSMKFLDVLNNPEDLGSLTRELRAWYSRIDTDRSKTITFDELRREFHKIQISETEAEVIMEFHDRNSVGESDKNAGLDEDEFIKTIIHILENSIPALNASDMVTMGYLFKKFGLPCPVL